VTLPDGIQGGTAAGGGDRAAGWPFVPGERVSTSTAAARARCASNFTNSPAGPDPRGRRAAGGGARPGGPPEPAAVDGRFLAFLGVAVVLIVTPGPDTAMVTRKRVPRRRSAAPSRTALGVSLGPAHVGAWRSAAGPGGAAGGLGPGVHGGQDRGPRRSLAVMGPAQPGGGRRRRRGGAAGPRDAGRPRRPRRRPAFLQGLPRATCSTPRRARSSSPWCRSSCGPGDPAARLAAMVRRLRRAGSARGCTSTAGWWRGARRRVRRPAAPGGSTG